MEAPSTELCSARTAPSPVHRRTSRSAEPVQTKSVITTLEKEHDKTLKDKNMILKHQAEEELLNWVSSHKCLKSNIQPGRIAHTGSDQKHITQLPPCMYSQYLLLLARQFSSCIFAEDYRNLWNHTCSSPFVTQLLPSQVGSIHGQSCSQDKAFYIAGRTKQGD